MKTKLTIFIVLCLLLVSCATSGTEKPAEEIQPTTEKVEEPAVEEVSAKAAYKVIRFFLSKF